MKRAWILLFALVLASCASAPTPTEIGNEANYGPYPENYQEIIRAYHQVLLKDPGSAQYRSFSIPKKAWWGNRITGSVFGWGVCVVYNARNSFGAYTGFKEAAYMINNGQVVDRLEDGMNFGKNMCRVMEQG